MIRSTFKLCFLFIFLSSISLVKAEGEDLDVEFDYDPESNHGPDHWADLKPSWSTCRDGQLQSPIAINVTEDSVDLTLSKLNVMYLPSEAVLRNNGHGIELNFLNFAGRLMLNGDAYFLQQLHFHSPSEHIIQRVRFPLEMHLVHRSESGEEAVISVPFLKSYHSDFLDQFWDLLPQVSDKYAEVKVETVSVNLPVGPFYARYNGSMTTPPCTENVSWTVCLWKWNTVSEDQLKALKALDLGPNSRPLVDDNGRDVSLFLSRS
ncbi:carbonic anhydrase [Marchantia polymorpha subsp. ruderalis]|uniref:Carbonic anhydrase n=2 Tax=Marchantia polymorpha TaxID=3197 RepID=A0A176VFL4_MARPO|nr:hypothetical protein AXG93_1847s1110 [Marchantia polymorpha subsp. ruderalis]PTQ36396.1 hypothetical protein MARPO_0064s0075 [Marchantia polymorpha]BBN18276.1 hypothetical protein Mp_8g01230 [Marchantia polymorpha subsp. ruderalis]|eukprot:PTQ36396.1 hypothetical protein MARPO_0064s0075 [Marchantia polymorpha]